MEQLDVRAGRGTLYDHFRSEPDRQTAANKIAGKPANKTSEFHQRARSERPN